MGPVPRSEVTDTPDQSLTGAGLERTGNVWKSSDRASSARPLSLLRSSSSSSSSCCFMAPACSAAAARLASIVSISLAWERSMADTSSENRQTLPAVWCSTAS
ncbi:hypothetical protein EYF80_049474 [Liparis tanakae]|uniref:Uncharacterized protein n=1 Tax=Liparis tanakae TaxID=230148 RepID=A0A4Z2FHH0_9TELE|nr:hypothetical protein EYF80_049474 [Liparis tanakae]